MKAVLRSIRMTLGIYCVVLFILTLGVCNAQSDPSTPTYYTVDSTLAYTWTRSVFVVHLPSASVLLLIHFSIGGILKLANAHKEVSRKETVICFAALVFATLQQGSAIITAAVT
jgi:hypothetical protein